MARVGNMVGQPCSENYPGYLSARNVRYVPWPASLSDAPCIEVVQATSSILYAFNINTIENEHKYPTLTQNFLGTFCLLVTNITATSLIGYKLWRVSSP